MKKSKLLLSVLLVVILALNAFACGKVPERNDTAVTGVTLNKTTLTLNVQQSETLVATVNPDSAVNKAVTWQTGNSAVATVDSDGNVTGVTAGSTDITVTTVDGEKTATCSVTVNAVNVPVTGVTLNKSSLEMRIGDQENLTATVAPANAGNKAVVWASSASGIASVNSVGVITAYDIGTAQITVTTQDGNFTAQCEVEVVATLVSGVSLNIHELTLGLGLGMERIRATVAPDNAYNKTVIWESDAPEIVDVIDGYVTPLALTTEPVTITAKTADGNFTDSCEVIVVNPTPISTPEDFIAIQNNIAEDFGTDTANITARKGYKITGYYYLTNNIDFNNADVRGIGTQDNQGDERFEGIFDGRGYSLMNMTVKAYKRDSSGTPAVYGNTHTFNDWGASVFVQVGKKGLVKNTGFVNVKSHAQGHNAVIAGANRGRIENCYVEGADISSVNSLGYEVASAYLAAENTAGAILRNCVVASGRAATGYSFAFVRVNSSTGVIENCFAATDGLVTKQTARNNPEFTNSHIFAAANVGTINFSALNPDIWEIAANVFPILKAKNPPVIGVRMSDSAITLTMGDSETETATLVATVLPVTALNRNVTWSSSDTGVVTVTQGGVLAAVSDGTATITATTEEGEFIDTCAVTVNASAVLVETISFTTSSYTLKVGQTYDLKTTISVLPANASHKAVTWSSSSADVTVSTSGVVTAVNITSSSVTITATATDGSGITGTCTVTVEVTPVTGVTLDKTTALLALGIENLVVLVPTVSPSGATDKTVSWSSSDDTVATVNNSGTVTAHKAGTATITVTTTSESKTATCVITVVAPTPISTAQEFSDIRKDMSIYWDGAKQTGTDTTADKYYYLTNDIDFGNTSFEELGTREGSGYSTTANAGPAVAFKGIFDGRGYSLKNISAITAHRYDGTNSTNGGADTYGGAIFGTIGVTGVVKNTGYINVSSTQAGRPAVIAVLTNGRIENCYIEGGTISSSGTAGNAGGIITANIAATGVIRNVVIKGVTANANVTAFTCNDGGIPSGAVVENCFATNDTLTKKQQAAGAAVTFTGSSLFAAASVGTVDFSALSTDFWNLPSGDFPALKALPLPSAAVTGVQISESTLSLAMGDPLTETATLTATVLPTFATNKGVSWSVTFAGLDEEDEVIEVDQDGVVTALKAGKATVVVTTAEGGFTATCAVTVLAGTISVTGVTLDNDTLSLTYGNTATLAADVQPADASVKTVTWSSNNESAATVSSSGVVTATGVGTATITVTTTNGGFTDTCEVTVSAKKLPTPAADFGSGNATTSWNQGSFCWDRTGVIGGASTATARTILDPSNPTKYVSGIEYIKVYVYLGTSSGPSGDAVLMFKITKSGTGQYNTLKSMGDVASLYCHTDTDSGFSGIGFGNYFCSGTLLKPFLEGCLTDNASKTVDSPATFAGTNVFFKFQFMADSSGNYSDGEISANCAWRYTSIS